MILIELTTIPQGTLPVAALRDHLRLGTGFADDALQDVLLEGFLGAALAAIEARTGKILIQRNFGWTLTAWRNAERQPLPLAPVTAIIGLFDVDAQGGETAVTQGWQLEMDDQRPALVATGSCLPTIHSGHSLRIEMQAGYGPGWTDLPADLRQAVMMLAADFYEHRSGGATGEQAIPFGVLSLIERYRTVRLFMGGGA